MNRPLTQKEVQLYNRFDSSWIQYRESCSEKTISGSYYCLLKQLVYWHITTRHLRFNMGTGRQLCISHLIPDGSPESFQRRAPLPSTSPGTLLLELHQTPFPPSRCLAFVFITSI